ncbi:glycosyltransferase [Puniceicoccaceae bacterium K14]|nr:glycosyltransferase [Puniceicoccaceae bacterium K14]
MEELPLITILTPVYNGESCLRNCIESVINQSYKNWVYVIIDNQSTDKTKEIAQSYADNDSRIVIKKTPNFITSVQNHNFSLQQVAPDSKYIKIVHADDWIFPECIEKMVEIGENFPRVGLIGSYRLDGKNVGHNGLPHPSETTSGKEIGRGVFLAKYELFGNPTSTMFRRAAISRDRDFFNENNIHYDTEACFQVLSEWDFGFVHQVLTKTTRHEGSITSKIDNLNTRFLGSLTCLYHFGEKFFSQEELTRLKKRYRATYYHRYAKGILKHYNADMVKYHKNERKKIGLKISRLRVLLNIVGIIIETLIDEKKWKKKLFKHPPLSQEFE